LRFFRSAVESLNLAVSIGHKNGRIGWDKDSYRPDGMSSHAYLRGANSLSPSLKRPDSGTEQCAYRGFRMRVWSFIRASTRLSGATGHRPTYSIIIEHFWKCGTSGNALDLYFDGTWFESNRRTDCATPLSAKVGTIFAIKRRSLGIFARGLRAQCPPPPRFESQTGH
jgi:hypothetical protein